MARKPIRPLPKPTRRKGALTYEIRVRVPEEARGGRFSGRHTTRSLGTRDKADAYEALPAIWQSLQTEFQDEARLLAAASLGASVAVDASTVTTSTLSPLRVFSNDEVCQIYRDRIINSAWTSRREHLMFVRSRPAWQQPTPEQLAEDYRTGLDSALASIRARLETCDLRQEQLFLKSLEKSGQGVVADQDGACLALALTDMQARVALRDDFIATRYQSGDTGSSPPVLQVPAPNQAPPLSTYVTTYVLRRKPSSERAESLQATVREFIEHLGDRPVDAYRSVDGSSFVSLLLTLPANWKKSKQLRNLRQADAAAKAKALDLPCQSPKTIRKKVAHLAMLFKAARGGHPGVTITFPLDEVPSTGPANKAKTPFVVSELQQLFDAKLGVDLHWISLISLFSGARSNEIAQLSRSNVRQFEDIWYLDIGKQMKLKNDDSSVRSVPVHRQLIDLGFVDFVQSKPDLIFPGLTQHRSGRFSDALGKSFTYRLKKFGIKRPKLSFHSLRHTFEARLKVTAPREAEARERIAGHALKGEAARYGNSYEAEAADMDWLKVKANVINTLHWQGLKLRRPGL